jgi:hypothetical protein
MTLDQKKHIKEMCKKIAKASSTVTEMEFYTFLAGQRDFIKDDLKYNYFATELKKYLRKHPVFDIHKFGVSS